VDSNWEPHGKVKRLDENHFAIVVRWGKKIVSRIYRIETLDPNPAVGSPALRLTKLADGSTSESYDLIRREHGWDCECPRFVRYGKCKHLAACKALGLIQET
jgi:hypothetical protein